ncbi:MAG: HvfC/BufC family peptide modification chaperone [Sphingosinicella sp.]|uniref:HvfC/BufC family peptide modification chaperone n=1 Tax=Sphingosinicella sp. TaxID=1917971 RepID=UPI00403831AC
MPELADFQLAFAAALDRDTRRGALERQPGFAVYRNTIASGLIEVLAGTYPVVAELLGPEGFAAIADEFAITSPPQSPVLLDYGAGFATFLEGQPWTSELPYLAGVAELEWLRSESHLAADATPLTNHDLTCFGLDALLSLRLPLHPAACFAWLKTPAMTIWLAHQNGGFDTLAPEWRAEGALFTRPGDAVRAALIDAPTHRLLAGLRLGESVGQAAAALAALYPEVALDDLLFTLIDSGAFMKPPHLERI